MRFSIGTFEDATLTIAKILDEEYPGHKWIDRMTVFVRELTVCMYFQYPKETMLDLESEEDYQSKVKHYSYPNNHLLDIKF